MSLGNLQKRCKKKEKDTIGDFRAGSAQAPEQVAF